MMVEALGIHRTVLALGGEVDGRRAEYPG
jgi:hypothetical protein